VTHHAIDDLADRLRERLLAEAGAAGGEAPPVERIRALVDREAGVLDASTREDLTARIARRSFGLGPLEPLLADPAVDEVMVNGAGPQGAVWVERAGRLERTDVAFATESELRDAIERILAPLGRRADEAEPMVDARLQDGSRVNVVLPPLAVDGPTLTIRRFRARPIGADELVALGTWTPEVMDFLARAVDARLNLVVSGGTGSGKTTTMNALSSFISTGDRVVTIEDTAELRLQQPHVVRLESRPANVEGRGEVTTRALLRNALRMRPDRIVVGEIRGGEGPRGGVASRRGAVPAGARRVADLPRVALLRPGHGVASGSVNPWFPDTKSLEALAVARAVQAATPQIPTVALPTFACPTPATDAFERSLAQQDARIQRAIAAQEACTQRMAQAQARMAQAQDDRAVRALSYTQDRLAGATTFLERFAQLPVWAEIREGIERWNERAPDVLLEFARRVQSFDLDGRPVVRLTWEDVRGRPWLAATLRALGWKVLEGRIFNDALLFGDAEPLPVAVTVAEIRKARGDPPGEAGGVEPAEADREQQARTCERRDRSGEPSCRRSASGASSLTGSSRSSRWAAASRRSSACSHPASTRSGGSPASAACRVASGGRSAMTRATRPRRSSLRPTPSPTR
jgi:pilus assembly protein CpaF